MLNLAPFGWMGWLAESLRVDFDTLRTPIKGEGADMC